MTPIKALQLSAKAAMSRRALLAGLGALAWPAHAAKPDLRVGPDEKVRSLAEAARLARDGWLIEVAAGDYRADVASWRRDGLRLRAVGGRVRMIADGAHAERKGIFVVNGRGVEIEGFDFSGATVPDNNGAGLRLETGSLVVRDCSFSDCQCGLLTNNDPDTRLLVENCEFSRPRPVASAFTHLLYAGRIAQLAVRGCHFHEGHHGHLLKSRAARSHIEGNHFVSGAASYELEFPNGGQARVLGNLIEQTGQSGNPLMLSYGAEGWAWPLNELDLAHNTWIDHLGGLPLRISTGGQTRVRAFNNLLMSPRGWHDMADWQAAGNQRQPLGSSLAATGRRTPAARADAQLPARRIARPAAPHRPGPARWRPAGALSGDNAGLCSPTDTPSTPATTPMSSSTWSWSRCFATWRRRTRPTPSWTRTPAPAATRSKAAMRRRRVSTASGIARLYDRKDLPEPLESPMWIWCKPVQHRWPAAPVPGLARASPIC